MAFASAACAAQPDFMLSPEQQATIEKAALAREAALAEARRLPAPTPAASPTERKPAACRMTSIADVALCREKVRLQGKWVERDVRYVRGAGGVGWLDFQGTYEVVAGRYRLSSDARGEALRLCWERDALTCDTVLGPRIDQYGGDDRYVVIARRDLPDETPLFFYVEAQPDGPGKVHGPLTSSAFARDKLKLALPEFDGIIVSR
ncbi:hypothetical protein DDF62_14055 [Caulobacter radicis]|uniref:hypothetical protein n=1 Tax=Caulobacter radicis TaxID=2172650 RepID=UPI000D5764B0|nr:hypothetical protein [Caulobacter radicis]PVM88648.1 hypothetical protein DDF62_14055 [Caulobacter radicis]